MLRYFGTSLIAFFNSTLEWNKQIKVSDNNDHW